MDIKKADKKPMAIHTKKKAKLHLKGASETKIKDSNAPAARHGPKAAGTAAGKSASGSAGMKPKKSRRRDADKTKTGKDGTDSGSSGYGGRKGKREKKKVSAPAAAVSAATKAALDEVEGGREVRDAYMTAYMLARPFADAAAAGRRVYRLKAAKEKKLQIKQRRSFIRNRENAACGSAAGAAEKSARMAADGAVKETAKGAAKKASKSPAKRAAADMRGLRSSAGSRMISLFMAKLRQDEAGSSRENQDSMGKALKDILMMHLSAMAKHIMQYAGLSLIGLFAAAALMALPAVAVVTFIYNSPFAVFFPSISSGETTQEVLSAHVAEFNDAVNAELAGHDGYDTSEKIYVNYGGSGTPDNFGDMLMVYMVKHGDGDTATDMTDVAKQNLKAVFDDMCSYTVTSRTDTDTDDEGNTTTTTVKEVNVWLKTCSDMASAYGFNGKQKEVLEQLMGFYGSL